MKKLLYILFAVTLFNSCSSDDEPVTPTQDYTSFTIMQNQIDNEPNVVVGYKVDGKYKKVASLGDLKKGIPSSEIKITDNSISELYIFSDYMGTSRSNITFTLKKNIKNVFEIPANAKGIEVKDKSDPTQYPQ